MKTITHGMADAAVKDPVFLAKFPEFVSARPGPALPVAGCRSCSQRRAEAATQSSFFKTLSLLPASRLENLKAYFGLSEMLVTMRDQNGGVQLKVV